MSNLEVREGRFSELMRTESLVEITLNGSDCSICCSFNFLGCLKI